MTMSYIKIALQSGSGRTAREVLRIAEARSGEEAGDCDAVVTPPNFPIEGEGLCEMP
jgi:hypothetical protein